MSFCLSSIFPHNSLRSKGWTFVVCGIMVRRQQINISPEHLTRSSSTISGPLKNLNTSLSDQDAWPPPTCKEGPHAQRRRKTSKL